jgi:3-mercaptopropionate dioxygenase
MTDLSNAGAPMLAEEDRPGLLDLVRQVRSCTETSSDPATIATAVADVLVAAQPTTALLTDEESAGSPDGYIRHTLHAEADFSVVAVVWRPGQVTEVHDHLVWCTFMILQGTESETLYRFADEHLSEVGRRERPVGSVSGTAPPDDIHRVANTGDEVAITLHVYGADLSEGTSVRRTYDLPA